MNLTTRPGQILSVILISISFSACRLAAPAPAAAPTLDILPTLNAVKTAAFETVAADFTRVAPAVTPTASETPTPADTPTPPPTLPPPPTRTPTRWTFTPALPSGGCAVISQAPDPGSSFLPGAGFDAWWHIKNKSGKTWIPEEVDLRYVSGAALHVREKDDVVELTVDVGHDETTTLIVDMQAPEQAGYYASNWAVYRGGQALCGLTVTIRVD